MKEIVFFGRIKSPKLLDFFNMRKCSIEKVNKSTGNYYSRYSKVMGTIDNWWSGRMLYEFK